MDVHDDSKELVPIQPDTEARDETEPIQSSEIKTIPDEDTVMEDGSEAPEADKSDQDEVKDDMEEATTNEASVEESPKSPPPESPSETPVCPVSALADEGAVTPSDFLCKTDGLESGNADSQLEPLTPSKVLEDDATENNAQVETDG